MKTLTEILRATLGENGKHHPHDLDPIRMLVAEGIRKDVRVNGAVISKEVSAALERIFLYDKIALPEYYEREPHLIVRVAQGLSIPSSNPFLRSLRNVGTSYARELAERELRKTKPRIRIHFPDSLRRTITYLEDESGLARYIETHLFHDHGNHYVFRLNGIKGH